MPIPFHQVVTIKEEALDEIHDNHLDDNSNLDDYNHLDDNNHLVDNNHLSDNTSEIDQYEKYLIIIIYYLKVVKDIDVLSM